MTMMTGMIAFLIRDGRLPCPDKPLPSRRNVILPYNQKAERLPGDDRRQTKSHGNARQNPSLPTGDAGNSSQRRLTPFIE